MAKKPLPPASVEAGALREGEFLPKHPATDVAHARHGTLKSGFSDEPQRGVSPEPSSDVAHPRHRSRLQSMSKIGLVINYAGLQLAVVKNSAGADCTPLKPIVDLFGLRWETQREKVTKSKYLSKFLGVCTLPRGGAGTQKRDENCILLSRVAAFIMSINPEQVRAQGNENSADFLEEKIEEWADALHDYEEIGIAINMNHVKVQESMRRQRMSFMAAFKIKDGLKEEQDRKAAAYMLRSWADELGVPYQMDIQDDT